MEHPRITIEIEERLVPHLIEVRNQMESESRFLFAEWVGAVIEAAETAKDRKIVEGTIKRHDDALRTLGES